MHRLKSKAGTPGYMAPELFKELPYTDKGDVFSLGVIIFSLVGGYSPFRGNNFERVMKANSKAILEFSPVVWDGVSNNCKQLIASMLESDPIKRISFSDILKHEV